MFFRPITALVSGVLFTNAVLAALTPDQVVTNVGVVTQVSSQLNSLLLGLTTTSTPQQVKTMSQSVTTGFQTIITSLAGDVDAMNATPPFDAPGAALVVNALTDFVKVHQVLLSTVLGKHTIFAQFFLTAPIVTILSNLEAGIDTFAFSMIALIPTNQDDVTNDKNSLDSSVQNTISLYQQFCIPSPLYPKFPPICISL